MTQTFRTIEDKLAAERAYVDQLAAAVDEYLAGLDPEAAGRFDRLMRSCDGVAIASATAAAGPFRELGLALMRLGYEAALERLWELQFGVAEDPQAAEADAQGGAS